MKSLVLCLFPILALILMLCFPTLSFEGASRGLMLWAGTVVPTLLPFMICSQLIVSLNGIPFLTAPFSPLLRHAFRLSQNGSYVFMSGLLCGYPMGAKTCAEFENWGLISPKEAQYLLAICNHPSPMFLLGYVMSELRYQIPTALLLISLYAPVLPISVLAACIYGYHGEKQAVSHIPDRIPFDQGLMNACETMVKIGGYIMLFSILSAFVLRLPIPAMLRAATLGLVEITTGVHALANTLSGNSTILFIILSVAFGGLSGIFQTNSVLTLPSSKKNALHPEEKNAGLSIRHYIIWKIVHGVLSGLTFILLSAFPVW